MRRRKRATDVVPGHLSRFDEARWGQEPALALRAWIDARKAHWAAHPSAWPDFMSLMAGPANIRAKRLGRRPPYPDEDEGQP